MRERPETRNAPLLLLIEDDRDTLVAAGRALEYYGFAVEIARGGDDGLLKAVSCQPDVIVTDVVMPRTSGVDVCERLHTDAATGRIPVIAYTGLTDPQALARLSRCGVRVFAIKPCLPSVLAAEARALIGADPGGALRVVTGDGQRLDEFAHEIASAAIR
jgi:DNA-binding response OmpR family regulator